MFEKIKEAIPYVVVGLSGLCLLIAMINGILDRGSDGRGT